MVSTRNSFTFITFIHQYFLLKIAFIDVTSYHNFYIKYTSLKHIRILKVLMHIVDGPNHIILCDALESPQIRPQIGPQK